MKYSNHSISLLLEAKSNFFCPKDFAQQQLLYLASTTYLIIGSLLVFPLLFVNLLYVLFFIYRKKARQSSLCICLFYLSLMCILKLAEFSLTALIKLEIIKINPSSGYLKKYSLLCNIIHFFERFSGDCSLYIVIFLQFQKYLLIRSRKFKFSRLVILNHAFSYMTCTTLFFIFLALDSFYFYDGFFINLNYCPFTMSFTCAVNSNFKILNSVEFNLFFYHNVHTLIYNAIPIILILLINVKTFLCLKKLNYINESGSSNRMNKMAWFIKLTKNFKGIGLELNDVDFISIGISSSCIFIAFFTNIFNYLIEWSSKIFNQKEVNIENMNSNYLTRIATIYIVISLLEFFNYEFFLIYQVTKCVSLKSEIKMFIKKMF